MPRGGKRKGAGRKRNERVRKKFTYSIRPSIALKIKAIADRNNVDQSDIVEEAIADTIRLREIKEMPELICEFIEKETGIESSEFLKEKKTRYVRTMRNLIIYLLRREALLTCEEIADRYKLDKRNAYRNVMIVQNCIDFPLNNHLENELRRILQRFYEFKKGTIKNETKTQ